MARDIPDDQQEREMAFRIALAQRIRDLRDERNISQDELAALANLHRAHLGFVEQAKRLPNLITLLRIAGALGVTLSELIDVTPQEADTQAS